MYGYLNWLIVSQFFLSHFLNKKVKYVQIITNVLLDLYPDMTISSKIVQVVIL